MGVNISTDRKKDLEIALLLLHQVELFEAAAKEMPVNMMVLYQRGRENAINRYSLSVEVIASFRPGVSVV